MGICVSSGEKKTQHTHKIKQAHKHFRAAFAIFSIYFTSTMTVFLKNLDLSLLKSHKKKPESTSRPPFTPFPVKLYRMLEDARRQGQEHIVSWLPDGESFQVHNPTRFVEEVLPLHFNQKKYKSFQRQLNFYGFLRVTSGPLEGSYGHPNFIQGDEERCKELKRHVNHSEKHRPTNGLIEPANSDTEMETTSDDEAMTESPSGQENLVLNGRESFKSIDGSNPFAILDEKRRKSFREGTRLSFVGKQVFSGDEAMTESPSGSENLVLNGRESFNSIDGSNPLAILDAKRRESFREGTRLSFVGKKFFFLSVEFTDI